jgi:hypothetical protein
MRAICVLYVPGTRSGRVVVVKEIGFPFIAGTGAGTLRDQGQGRLHIFLLDTTRTTALTARGLLVVVVVVMLLLLWWL